jgi:hypothetical protein
VSEGSSQISDPPVPDSITSFCLLSGEAVKIGCLYLIDGGESTLLSNCASDRDNFVTNGAVIKQKRRSGQRYGLVTLLLRDLYFSAKLAGGAII